MRRFGGSPRPDDEGAHSRPSRPSRPRHRDRHGRGIRGSLAPADVPLTLTRSERFDEYVLDAVEQVERVVLGNLSQAGLSLGNPALAEQLSLVEYGIEEVPPDAVLAAAESGAEPLSMGRSEPATAGAPPRIVLYRRPVELRTPDLRDRAALVHELLVEQLADLLGVSADDLDPPEVD